MMCIIPNLAFNEGSKKKNEGEKEETTKCEFANKIEFAKFVIGRLAEDKIRAVELCINSVLIVSNCHS